MANAGSVSLAGYPAFQEREDQGDRPQASPVGPLQSILGTQARWSELSLLGDPWFKSPGTGDVDRRVRPRHLPLVLSEGQRDAARSLASSALACGSSWKSWWTYECRDSGDRELRMICQTHCGTRACERCSAKIRARECARVNGPWKLFLTLTIPREPWSCVEAWERVHDWLADWIRELRREVAWSKDSKHRKTSKGQKAALERWKLARDRVRCSSEFEYAWAIEAHKDGYPHVHVCVSPDWIEYSFVRELWARCAGVMYANVNGRKVWNVEGTCRYLSKYISKQSLTLDILAVLKRRRLWACSLKAPEKEESRWIEQGKETTQELEYQCYEREVWGCNEGWKLECGKDGRYALWSRDIVDNSYSCIQLSESYNEDISSNTAEINVSEFKRNAKKSIAKVRRERWGEDTWKILSERFLLDKL